MQLRLHGMSKVIAAVSALSLAAYILGSWKVLEVVKRDTTKTQNTDVERRTDDNHVNSPSVVERTFAVNDGVKTCACGNRTFYGLEAPDGVHSICSEGATARGRSQKVVSFNFYGKTNAWRPYFPGITSNAAMLPKAYPGWTMRVYHALPAGHSSLCELSCEFPHLDLCDTRRIPGLGDVRSWQNNAWRFFPIGDPLVDLAMFRDLDSDFIERELAAVDQWLKSELTFHVMRDTPAQGLTPVLAGMWGARVSQRRTQLRFHLPLVTNLTFKERRNDQFKLEEHLWPIMKGDVMQHDSYTCVTYSPFGNVHPFLTRRSETDVLNWIGARKRNYTEPLLNVCPEECRPPENKDWTYC